MTFCDVTMLYCARGGGIRTYTDRKLEWFARQHRHRYVLIVPGRRTMHRAVSPTATVMYVRGLPLRGDPDGYRMFMDLPALWGAVRRCAPDVLEAGDPWASGLLALLLRRRQHAPLVASFFHADPVTTYFEPALSRLWPQWLRSNMARAARDTFYRLQASYDLTMVGSRFLADRLAARGIHRVRVTPFGVDPALFDVGCARAAPGRPRRLLYAGRLDRDKDVELLLEILPSLLERDDVSVTVAGTGGLRSAFEDITHARFHYAGYVDGREGVVDLYRRHDVFVAPCAYETFGLAALEAAAAGLIVVGADAGGVGELLRSMASPFMFHAGDSSSLLAAIRAALADDWQRASADSRALAVRYGTWSDAIGRLVSTYEQLIDDGITQSPRRSPREENALRPLRTSRETVVESDGP